MKKAKRERVSPLDRGWTGGHPGGRKIGPPDPVGDCKKHFERYFCLIIHRAVRIYVSN